MEINEREVLARHIYDELITGILRVLSRLDLSVTQESVQQQVITAWNSPLWYLYDLWLCSLHLTVDKYSMKICYVFE